ncbi:hypothetical protein EYF80_003574 [Liparis tanakae]|uniref:Uncharacterized protein n=1 Tax=Liparis tanakae TaxID=230148 RepID=A0A4Z2J805_9TELE|nr:hypothetical protein EYF80_003574 [Liparis tanakae]
MKIPTRRSVTPGRCGPSRGRSQSSRNANPGRTPATPRGSPNRGSARGQRVRPRARSAGESENPGDNDASWPFPPGGGH